MRTSESSPALLAGGMHPVLTSTEHSLGFEDVVLVQGQALGPDVQVLSLEREENEPELQLMELLECDDAGFPTLEAEEVERDMVSHMESAAQAATLLIRPGVRVTQLVAADFESRRREKSRRPRRRPVGPFTPLLEVLGEDTAAPLPYPPWLAVFNRLQVGLARPLPCRTVVVRPSEGSAGEGEEDDEMASALAAADPATRLSLRRKASYTEPERLPTPSLHEDTYGQWMQQQRPRMYAESSSECKEMAGGPFSAQRLSPTNVTAVAVDGTTERCFRAVQSQDFPDLIAILKEASESGAVVDNWTDEFGNTPLIAAACTGARRVARLLLKQGCAVDACNVFGNTALHFSMELGFEAMTRYLRKKSATVDTACNELGRVAGDRVAEDACE
jgi:hypothetical protein